MLDEALLQKADAGDVDACVKVGYFYFWGEEVPTDFEKSFKYMRMAAEAGNASAQAHVAQCYEGNMWGAPCEDLTLAKHYYDLALAQNDEHAQWCIAHNYHIGWHGYPQDNEKAFEYFLKSAQNGSDKGQLDLALCYIRGQGTIANMAEGMRWLEEAVRNGNEEARRRLGAGLLSGYGSFEDEDVERGYSLLKEAVTKGDQEAKEFLERFDRELKQNHANLHTWRLLMLGGAAETQNDGINAVRYYQDACKAGCSQAMTFLGGIYQRGAQGIERNERLAVSWFQKGADAGNASSQAMLALCYLEGRGVAPDISMAEKWFIKAAEQNDVGAMVCLGDIYIKNPSTYAKAESLYKRAIEMQEFAEEELITNAKATLGYLYGLEGKYSQGIPLLTEAAQKGNSSAQYGLGVAYYNGEGIAQNYEKAIHWWKQAAADGNEAAIEALSKWGNRPQNSSNYDGVSKSSSGGCYIATAVYGNYDCPQVWTLRRFRDDVLATHFIGRIFIKMYYAVSPKMVKYFGKKEWFIKFWRGHLDSLVQRLIAEGISDKPYIDVSEM